MKLIRIPLFKSHEQTPTIVVCIIVILLSIIGIAIYMGIVSLYDYVEVGSVSYWILLIVGSPIAFLANFFGVFGLLIGTVFGVLSLIVSVISAVIRFVGYKGNI